MLDAIPDTQTDQPLAAAAILNPPADALGVYVLNVGDGDAIVLQFPEVNGARRYAVIDSNSGAKSMSMLDQLGATSLRFICATHPHIDHIRGLRDVFRHVNGDVGEFWDSGFRYTSKTYRQLLQEVAQAPTYFLRPTAGYEAFVNGVRLTVLSPSIALRNRYDTYGVDPNNASIVLRLEYPSQPPIEAVLAREGDQPPAERKTRTMILGGDAQTDAWSHVLEDFPHLDQDPANWARAIQARQGRQPLLSDVLKVSHHASKHGINLELIERMGDSTGGGRTNGPRHLISSCGVPSTHGFPHAVAQEIMREVREPLAKNGGIRSADHKLGIHYTAQQIDDGAGGIAPAGSVAVLLYADASPPDLYRLCDDTPDPIELHKARKVS